MKKEIVKFLILLLVALGAGPAGAALWQWSTNASLNGSIDPTINFQEGMAPSAVNDSARALMAAVAVARQDWQANNTTTGTATAYAYTSSQGFPSLIALNNQMLAFIPGTTNGAAVTLSVDGLAAAPITDGAGTGIPAGSLIAGTPYMVTYYSSPNQFRLWNFFGNTGTPLGGILWSTALTAPSSAFIAPSGQCISTTTYAAYWAQQGSPASGICSGGQFQIIDMRGKVAAALDTLNASAANLLTSSATGCGTAMTTVGAVCANGKEGYALSLAQLPTGISSTGTNTVIVNSSVDVVQNGTISSAVAGGTVGGFNTTAPTNAHLTSSGSNSTTVASTNTNGTAHPTVQPTIGLIPYLRIL